MVSVDLNVILRQGSNPQSILNTIDWIVAQSNQVDVNHCDLLPGSIDIQAGVEYVLLKGVHGPK